MIYEVVPFFVTTYDDYCYFFTIVDDYTRSIWVYLLRVNSEVPNILQSSFTLVETQLHIKIKSLKSDNGRQFDIKDLYAFKGVIHQLSYIDTPQQNSVVERQHQNILNVARAFIFKSNIPLYFWVDSILTATYLINQIPTPFLSNKSPYEFLFKVAPTYQ